MPMLTTARIRSPVCPVHAPERTESVNSPIRSSTACTSVTTSWPSTPSAAARGIRSAACSTARSSLVLMCSPANIASVRSGSPAAAGQRGRAGGSVSRVIRCLE